MKKLLVGSGLLAGVVVAVLLWRTTPGGPPGRSAPRLAAEASTAHDPEPSGSHGILSLTTIASGATAAMENSDPPLVPSGDFELTMSDAEVHAIVEARYGPFVRSLTLAPAAHARLSELLVERQHAAIDVANAAMIAGLNPIRDLPLIQRAIALAEADVDADIAREHGAAVAAACREFGTTQPERSTVDQLVRALAGTAEPLEPGQQQRLVRILNSGAASSAPTDINSAIFGRPHRRTSVGTATLAAAAAELSPRQLDALRHLAQANPADQAESN